MTIDPCNVSFFMVLALYSEGCGGVRYRNGRARGMIKYVGPKDGAPGKFLCVTFGSGTVYQEGAYAEAAMKSALDQGNCLEFLSQNSLVLAVNRDYPGELWLNPDSQDLWKYTVDGVQYKL
jgi:hypothetical protein